MDALVVDWFDTSRFMPHGHCYLWSPSVLAMHVGSDVLIGAAYMIIPFGLFALQRRRPDLPFRGLFVWFSAFIALCGATHWLAAWNVWHVEYWIEGAVKTATAVASLPAAIAMWRAVPAILALPSRRQLEVANSELSTSNAELEGFVSTAAHDLRSPLEGTRLLLETMTRRREPPLSERDVADLNQAVAELRRMSAAVDARLRLSKLAREPLRVAQVDATAIAGRIVDRLAKADPMAKVRVSIQPGMSLEADPALFETMLENLLGNAWKFTRHVASPQVEVTMRDLPSGRELHVRDNGMGFAPAEAKLLFKPLVRLSGACKVPGQGLGLATVARIAELHGGRVGATAAPDAGAEFVVTLPRGACEPRELQPG